MIRNFSLFIDDILDNIYLIEKSTNNISEDEFSSNSDIIDANVRRLEIIGEAAKNIPEKIKIRYNGIPWKDIIGFRDVMIHSYFVVNIKRVWKVIQNDLPTLKKQILDIKKELDKENKK